MCYNQIGKFTDMNKIVLHIFPSNLQGDLNIMQLKNYIHEISTTQDLFLQLVCTMKQCLICTQIKLLSSVFIFSTVFIFSITVDSITAYYIRFFAYCLHVLSSQLVVAPLERALLTTQSFLHACLLVVTQYSKSAPLKQMEEKYKIIHTCPRNCN